MAPLGLPTLPPFHVAVADATCCGIVDSPDLAATVPRRLYTKKSLPPQIRNGKHLGISAVMGVPQKGWFIHAYTCLYRKIWFINGWFRGPPIYGNPHLENEEEKKITSSHALWIQPSLLKGSVTGVWWLGGDLYLLWIIEMVDRFWATLPKGFALTPKFTSLILGYVRLPNDATLRMINWAKVEQSEWMTKI